jgi:hypothetical protein
VLWVECHTCLLSADIALESSLIQSHREGREPAILGEGGKGGGKDE